MAAFEADVNLTETVGRLNGIERDIEAFRVIIQEKVDDAVREVAEDFRTELKKQIKKSDIDERTGELLNSWKVTPKGLAHYEIRSTADHAVFLELGTKAHTIRGNPWLKFRPEGRNSGRYPDREMVLNDDGSLNEQKSDVGKSGVIVSRHDPLAGGDNLGEYVAQSVQHPGNDAYLYFEKTTEVRPWTEELNERIEAATIEALREANLQ